MDHGRFVGRVGALAAALGIGIVLASAAPTHAETGDGAATTAEQESAASRDSGTRQPRLSRSGQVKTRGATEQRELQTHSSADELDKKLTEVDRGETPTETSSPDRAQRDPTSSQAVVIDPPAESTSDDLGEDFNVTVVEPSAADLETVAGPNLSLAQHPDLTETPGAAAVAFTVPSPRVTTLSLEVSEPLPPLAPAAPLASPALLVMFGAALRTSPDTESISRTSAGVEPTALTLAAENNAPSITSIFVSNPGLLSARVTGRVRADDADRDKLTYTAKVAGGGSVTINSRGSFTYKPTAAARHAAAAGATTDTLTVTVTDSNGASASMVVDVPIRPANVRPTGRASIRETNPATGAVTGVITASDRDGDTLTFAGTGPTARGNVVVKTDGTFVYTPTAAAREAATSPFRRTDRFAVTINDGHGGTRAVTVKVRILTPDKNTAPTVGSPAYTISSVATSTGVVTGKVNVADPDGFPLTYKLAKAIDTKVGKVSVNSSTGVFTFTPTTSAREKAHGTSGKDTVKFTVTASDGAASASVTVTAEISPKAPPVSTLKQKIASFVTKTRGKEIANPDGSYAGECVSLVRQFLEQVHSIRTGKWGNAIDYRKGASGGNELEKRGFVWRTDKKFADGDIIVWDSYIDGKNFGHVGIFYQGQVYDQNDTRHSPARTANFSGPVWSSGYRGYWRKA